MECSPFIASIWAYRSRALRRGCPVIFLGHPPARAAESPLLATADFLPPLAPTSAAEPRHPHPPGVAHTCASTDRARIRSLRVPPPPVGSADLHAGLAPPRFVCRSHQNAGGASPRLRPILSLLSSGPFSPTRTRCPLNRGNLSSLRSALVWSPLFLNFKELRTNFGINYLIMFPFQCLPQLISQLIVFL